MASKYQCVHLETSTDIPLNEIAKSREGSSCSDCTCYGPNLWICLHRDCLRIGCSENFNDHGTKHYCKTPSHCVHMNLSTQRIWCYICESEVFMNEKRRTIVYQDSENEDGVSVHYVDRRSRGGSYSSLKDIERRSSGTYGFDKNVGLNVSMSGDSDNSSDVDETTELNGKPRGLVGLSNIGNTCYMNSALQALSNTPPLTNFFLDCVAAVQISSENKKPGLSRSYQRLIREIWNKKTRGYVVPSGILYGIRSVHPMFRGYHQHDTQEFLRCFMDQLHEELKEPVTMTADEPHLRLTPNISPPEDNGLDPGYSHLNTSYETLWRDSPSPSQSDGEYETCDSGVSERSSLSDDTERQQLFATMDMTITNGSASPDDTLCDEQSPEGDGDGNPDKTVVTSSQAAKRKLSPTRSPIHRCKLTAVQYKGSNVIESQPSTSNSSNNTVSSSTNKKTIKHRSIISDIFDGKLLSSVQCLTCDRISTRIETFQDLSLPIPSRDHITMLHQTTSGAKTTTQQSAGAQSAGATCTEVANRDGWWLGWLWGWVRSWFYGPAISLHDCLAAFFSADELKGDNMYSCEKCNKLRNGVKFSKVIELPEVLCIHLKRFRHELMFSSKISSQVSFPLTGLDMRPYLHKDCISTISNYSLSSVICHHGTAGGGHYTCYALNSTTGAWFEFDDQCVTQVQPETVQACEAYVLFYRKNSQAMVPIRQKVYELMEMSQNYISNSSSSSIADIRFYVSKQWFNRFNTCAEPGPIDNTDFLCPHGGVPPTRLLYVDKLTVVISQSVWEYLYNTFGGGPPCNRLYECSACKQQAEAIKRRIQTEFDTFVQLNKEFQNIESSCYAISMNWLRQWQSFVRGQTEDPPGPIDNSSIVLPPSKGGSHEQPTLKNGSDYVQMSEDQWWFFYRIYSGGPEVKLRDSVKNSPPVASTTKTNDKTDIVQNRDVTESDAVKNRQDSTEICSSTVSISSGEMRSTHLSSYDSSSSTLTCNHNQEVDTSSSGVFSLTDTSIISNEATSTVDSSKIGGHYTDQIPNDTSVIKVHSPSPDNGYSQSETSGGEQKTNGIDNNVLRSPDKVPEFVIPGLKRPPKKYYMQSSARTRHHKHSNRWDSKSSDGHVSEQYIPEQSNGYSDDDAKVVSTTPSKFESGTSTEKRRKSFAEDGMPAVHGKMRKSTSRSDESSFDSVDNDVKVNGTGRKGYKTKKNYRSKKSSSKSSSNSSTKYLEVETDKKTKIPSSNEGGDVGNLNL